MEKPIDEITEGKVSETQNIDTTFNDDKRTSDKEIREEGNVAGEDAQDTDTFSELYEESLKSIQEGEVVQGEIVQIDKEYVLVDIGYKSDSQGGGQGGSSFRTERG
jgi:small subunit ribosomal protein S1